jgi:hypothetical protein
MAVFTEFVSLPLRNPTPLMTRVSPPAKEPEDLEIDVTASSDVYEVVLRAVPFPFTVT